MHIRVNWTPAPGPLPWLPPTQTENIPGRHSKTPVAQHALCLGAPPVSRRHSITGKEKIIQAKAGRTLNARSWMFVFLFDVERSMFDVHLFTRARMAQMQPVNVSKIT